MLQVDQKIKIFKSCVRGKESKFYQIQILNRSSKIMEWNRISIENFNDLCKVWRHLKISVVGIPTAECTQPLVMLTRELMLPSTKRFSISALVGESPNCMNPIEVAALWKFYTTTKSKIFRRVLIPDIKCKSKTQYQIENAIPFISYSYKRSLNSSVYWYGYLYLCYCIY